MYSEDNCNLCIRKFTCLTVGDIIRIHHAECVYPLQVVELKPSNAVSIVETDCEVDFDEPEGYKDSKYYKEELANKERIAAAAAAVVPTDLPVRPVQKGKVETTSESEKAAFIPFAGSARRIDGKTSQSSKESSSVSVSTSSTSVKQNAGSAALARFSASQLTTSTTTTSTSSSTSTSYQSKIGDKYSTLKASTSAFTGTARKLA